jgi:hypothetical protein
VRKTRTLLQVADRELDNGVTRVIGVQRDRVAETIGKTRLTGCNISGTILGIMQHIWYHCWRSTIYDVIVVDLQ